MTISSTTELVCLALNDALTTSASQMDMRVPALKLGIAQCTSTASREHAQLSKGWASLALTSTSAEGQPPVGSTVPPAFTGSVRST